ncbi:MAG: hypothetical protein QME14_07085 [Methanobacteriaceae archaeon]|nr:hypothetical protein [Methanobacteriaceae archaeon]
MPNETKMEELKKSLKGRDCKIIKQEKVMEIVFKNAEDADWFEDLMETHHGSSSVSCVMSMRPLGKGKNHKFVFNIKDLGNFIELIKNG